MIPKIIWQGGEVEYNSLSDVQRPSAETWQKLNPDWEYRYSSNDKKREEVYAYSLDLGLLYDQVVGPFKCDIWRYIMLYQYGGVYADLDTGAVLPLKILDLDVFSDIINKELIIPPQETTVKYTNAIVECCDGCQMYYKEVGYVQGNDFISNDRFIAQKNSLILKEVIDEMLFRLKMWKKNCGSLEKSFNHDHSLKSIVDCSIYDKVIQNNYEKISYMFIFGKHSLKRKDKTVFKDLFENYNIFNGDMLPVSNLFGPEFKLIN